MGGREREKHKHKIWAKNMDFEGSPNTKLKTLFEKRTVSISKSIKFLFKIKLRYIII